MASQQTTVDFICEQMSGAGEISARKMFGEYGVYCDAKFIGVICNDTLFLKPTAAGTSAAPDLEHAPAYPGAKPSLIITEDRLEDTAWLTHFVRLTHDALPAPKPKKPKARNP